MVGQPLQQRIFPEQSYQGTASHTVSTGESKQKRLLNCKQGNTGYIYNIKRDTGIENISEIEAGNCGKLLSFRVRTLSSSPNSMTFHDFFHDLIGLAVTFKNFQNFTRFSIFFTINSSTDTNSGIHQNACRSRRFITPLYLTLSLPCHLQQKIYQTKL